MTKPNIIQEYNATKEYLQRELNRLVRRKPKEVYTKRRITHLREYLHYMEIGYEAGYDQAIMNREEDGYQE